MHSKVDNFSVPPAKGNTTDRQDDDENMSDQPHTPHNNEIALQPS
jgi:hypothetical protein